MKIISGGQTGIDRAALDVALELGLEAGGWVPAGRLDEAGRIPDKYPVTELPDGGFTERTVRNVEEADGTIIMYSGELRGGSKQTRVFCQKLMKPFELIDARTTAATEAAAKIREFIARRAIKVLNVAGPRESEWPEGYDYAREALAAALKPYS